MAALLLAITAACAQAAEPVVLVGRVVGVVDGDTLTLLVSRDEKRIRLAQIDAPERRQPHGRAAKKALSGLSFGRQARAVVTDTDRYGRRVAEVFVDGVNLNQEMVRRGHAWAYTQYSPSAAIIEIEDAARAAGLGLWALPEAERDPPWIWRSAKKAVPASPGAFNCDVRQTCTQMTSCQEALFALNTCGDSRLDSDGDGVPCENLCGASSAR